MRLDTQHASPLVILHPMSFGLKMDYFVSHSVVFGHIGLCTSLGSFIPYEVL